MKGRAKEQKGIEYYMQLPYSILLHEVEDEGEKYWVAEVPDLPGCRSHGSTVEEAVKSVEEAKKDWILDSIKEGEEVPTPVERDRYSGRILVRMSRSLHRSLALVAESEKLSLNQLIVTMLAKEVGRLSVLNRVEDKVDNLLQRISDVLEEEEVRISFSKSLRVMSHPQEHEQRFVVDTSLSMEDLAVAANMGAFTPGVATTVPSFQDLSIYPYFQYPGQQRVIYSAKKGMGENEVKTERE